jgi:hypothetical protein
LTFGRHLSGKLGSEIGQGGCILIAEVTAC